MRTLLVATLILDTALTILWLQCGAWGGATVALLCATWAAHHLAGGGP